MGSGRGAAAPDHGAAARAPVQAPGRLKVSRSVADCYARAGCRGHGKGFERYGGFTRIRA
jgi:hypothetical protein